MCLEVNEIKLYIQDGCFRCSGIEIKYRYLAESPGCLASGMAHSTFIASPYRAALQCALLCSQRGILYYSTPREESFTILLPERNPLLFYSQRGILARTGPGCRTALRS